MHAIRSLAILSVAVLSGSLLVGCGSGDDTNGLILAPNDFPEAAEYLLFPDARGLGRSLVETLETMVFQPPECKAPRQEEAQLMLESDVTIAEAKTPASTYYATILVERSAITPSLIEEMYLGTCSSAVAIRTINGQPAESSAYELTQTTGPDGISADHVLVIEQTATTTSMFPQDTSPPQMLYSRTGYAWIGPYFVILEQSGAELPPELRAEFDHLFRIAIAKVPQ